MTEDKLDEVLQASGISDCVKMARNIAQVVEHTAAPAQLPPPPSRPSPVSLSQRRELRLKTAIYLFSARLAVAVNPTSSLISSCTSPFSISGGESVLLSSGIHSFPFKLGLPLGLPSTFLGKHGWVQYFCKAALREENGLTHKNQQGRIPSTSSMSLQFTLPLTVQRFGQICHI